ncbi:biotin--[acetyl-CoA-carboxylase] ligase [Candidatus Pelagibacter sp. HIMB1517]|uniref:biotin--[acetyl-CoA-carboxylase] ligase n=1 Tax=Candidatus Pelagibacter sp. HIMB1517 TaxID=3413341 RepID=UPI003F870FB2
MDKTNSTNEFCINLIKNNISTNGIVSAEIQTNGRGRYGNKWISKKGNIFLSFYKKIKLQRDIIKYQYKVLKIVKNFLIKKGLKEQNIQIKDPNDILINNKKICGILVESYKNNKSLFVIAGIGLNLASSPNLKKYRTTFLNKYLKKKVNKLDFLEFIKKNFNKL